MLVARIDSAMNDVWLLSYREEARLIGLFAASATGFCMYVGGADCVRSPSDFTPRNARCTVSGREQPAEGPIEALRRSSHWTLGYPDAALAEADEAVKKAREFDQAPMLAHALFITSFTLLLCGRSAITNLKEVASLAAEKGASFWKGIRMINQP